MSRRKQFFISCFLFLTALSACSQPPAGPATPSAPPSTTPAKIAQVTSLNFVTASAEEAQIVAGGSGDAIVTVIVQNGYHVNANPATDTYLKATELIVEPDDGLSIGLIKYPTAISKKFSFSDKKLAVYEGEVPIKVLLKATAAAPKGGRKLTAKLNVQACDDQLCYPPGTLELTIAVTTR